LIEAQHLAHNLWVNGDIKGHNEAIKKIDDLRTEVLHDHQLDKLNLVFLPRSFAWCSVGVYQNLHMYIQAGMLGMRPEEKMVFILDRKTPYLTNSCYLNYWEKYMAIITDPKEIKALEPLERCLTLPIHFYIKLNGKVYHSHVALGIVQEQWDKAQVEN